MKRYHPGFLGALFLILLRVAIGWHFLYEGLDKYQTTQRGDRPWSAEPYLRASTGPFAGHFRGLVPDVDGLSRLDLEALETAWRGELDRVQSGYGFDADQQTKADEALKTQVEKAEAWFNEPENADKVKKYREDVLVVNERETALPPLSYEHERLAERRKGLEATRRELVANVDGWDKALNDAWSKLATAEQLQRSLPARPRTQIDLVNLTTMYGLIICGGCLILGLFTPLAALGGAALLALFYLSMPPLRVGMPQGPNSEGHYWIVNKNVIEFLACLFIAATPSGTWVGLDALLFGWFGRKRAAESTDDDDEPRPRFRPR